MTTLTIEQARAEQIQKEAEERYPMSNKDTDTIIALNAGAQGGYIAGRTVNIERERELEDCLRAMVGRMDKMMWTDGPPSVLTIAKRLLTPKQSDNE